jgi:hypothetical protein
MAMGMPMMGGMAMGVPGMAGMAGMGGMAMGVPGMAGMAGGGLAGIAGVAGAGGLGGLQMQQQLIQQQMQQYQAYLQQQQQLVEANAARQRTVQVASYSSEEEARSHAQKLKGSGYTAFYVPAKVKSRTWYRVSVGLFTTRQEALGYRKSFMKNAKVSSAIVQKITN